MRDLGVRCVVKQKIKGLFMSGSQTSREERGMGRLEVDKPFHTEDVRFRLGRRRR